MKYPLYKNEREALRLPGGRPIGRLSLENLKSGDLANEDLGIHRETLLAQARIAESSGFPQLALNLSRAAELADIPESELLSVYEALRPGRMDHGALLQLAERVEEIYDAPLTAQFIREAADISFIVDRC
jgi:propanediol dehydratase small subunit